MTDTHTTSDDDHVGAKHHVDEDGGPQGGASTAVAADGRGGGSAADSEDLTRRILGVLEQWSSQRDRATARTEELSSDVLAAVRAYADLRSALAGPGEPLMTRIVKVEPPQQSPGAAIEIHVRDAVVDHDAWPPGEVAFTSGNGNVIGDIKYRHDRGNDQIVEVDVPERATTGKLTVRLPRAEVTWDQDFVVETNP